MKFDEDDGRVVNSNTLIIFLYFFAKLSRLLKKNKIE